MANASILNVIFHTIKRKPPRLGVAKSLWVARDDPLLWPARVAASRFPQ